MNQVFHIFKKDARHFWIESAVSIAIAAGFVWSEIHIWTAPEDLSGGFVSFLKALPTILLVLSWWFTITRLVQDEALVGDRQFWITRPYEWNQLLAAKILFVVAFINFPLLTAQVFLLAKAGFNPASYVPGLLWMQILLAVFMLLPAAALATVTSNVVQMGLGSLIIFLFMGGVAALSNYIPSSSFSFETDYLPTAIVIGISSFVIVLQYARRQTAKSRWMIAGAAGAILLVMLATPYRLLVAHKYPELGVGQQSPVRLALSPVNPAASNGEERFSSGDSVSLNVPVTLFGLDSHSVVVIEGMMVRIEPPNAAARNSGWESKTIFLFPGQRGTQLDFELPRKFLESMKSIAVKTQISLIMTEFHDVNGRDLIASRGEFEIPGLGKCTAKARFSDWLVCKSALRKPPSFLVTADLSMSTCPSRRDDPPVQRGELGHSWQVNSDSGPAEFGFSPIQSFDIYLSSVNYSMAARGICPGTPFVLSDLVAGQSFRTMLELDNVKLDDYRFRFDQYEFRIP